MPAAPAPLTAWAVTSGEAGMRAQARGLAQAVAGRVVEKTPRLSAPWRWAPPGLLPHPLAHLDPSFDGLSPPWPDLIVTCGRRSAALGAAVRAASGGATLAVHIQDPRLPIDRFDLVVALEHDRMAPAANVISTATAMHDVTSERLAAAADAWRERFAALGQPLAGVLVGGATRRRPFGPGEAGRLIVGLQRLRNQAGAGLAISPSRRTSAEVVAALRAAFAADARVFLWNGAGDNPYLGILALANRLVVTGDSVSMVSEAVSTALPVDVFEPDSDRHERFLERLIAIGRVRRFDGDPTTPPRATPINATLEAAEAVRRRLQARTGVVGQAN